MKDPDGALPPPESCTLMEPAMFFGTDKTVGETSSRTPTILYSIVVRGGAAIAVAPSSAAADPPQQSIIQRWKRRFMASIDDFPDAADLRDVDRDFENGVLTPDETGGVDRRLAGFLDLHKVRVGVARK